MSCENWYNSKNFLMCREPQIDVIYINKEHIGRINVKIFETILMRDNTKEETNGILEEYSEDIYIPYTSRISLIPDDPDNPIEMITELDKVPNDCLGLAEFITSDCPLNYDTGPGRLCEKSSKKVIGNVSGKRGNKINRNIADKSTIDIKDVSPGETLFLAREEGYVGSGSCPHHAAYVLFEDELPFDIIEPVKFIITIEADASKDELPKPVFDIYIKKKIPRAITELIDDPIKKSIVNGIKPFNMRYKEEYGEGAKYAILEEAPLKKTMYGKGGKSRKKKRKSRRKNRKSRRKNNTRRRK